MLMVMAGEKNNGIGSMGSAPNAYISPYVNLSFRDEKENPSLYYASVETVYAANNGANLINMSFRNIYGTAQKLSRFFFDSNYYNSFEYCMKYAIESKKVPLIISAGNDAIDIENVFPAILSPISGVITVGGVDVIPYNGYDYSGNPNLVGNPFPNYTASHRPVGGGSNFGEHLVWSPYQDIITSNPYLEPLYPYISSDGTSNSAAFTSGVVALMKSRNPDLTPAEIEDILHSTASKEVKPHIVMKDSLFKDSENMKLIDAEEAVKEAIRRNKQSVSNPRSNNPDDYIAKPYYGTFTLTNSLNDNSTNNKPIGTLKLDNGTSIDILRTVSNEELQKANGKYVKAFAWSPEVTKFSEGYELLSIEETTERPQPINNKIAFSKHDENYRNQIYTINPDGTDLTKITTVYGYSLAWSPDKSKLAYGYWENGFNGYRIFTMNADGSDKKQLSYSLNDEDDYPVWSFDSSKIAYIRYYYDGTAQAGLRVVNPDGTNDRELIRRENILSDNIAFSYDGTKVAYIAEDGNIYVVNIDGSNNHKVTNSNDTYYVNWTSDNKLVYEGSYDIRKINEDGTNEISLGYGENPIVSNDGSKIAFSNSDYVNNVYSSDLYVMDTNGNNIVNITNNNTNGSMSDISWSPDNNKLLYLFRDYSNYTYGLYTVNLDGTNKNKLNISSDYFRYTKWSVKSDKNKRKTNNKTRRDRIVW